MKGFTKFLTASAICCGLLLSSSGFAVQSVFTKRQVVVNEPDLMVVTFAKSPLHALGGANDTVNLCAATLTCNNVSIHNTSPYRMRINWSRGTVYDVPAGDYLEFTVARNYSSNFWVALVRPDNMMRKFDCNLSTETIRCSK